MAPLVILIAVLLLAAVIFPLWVFSRISGLTADRDQLRRRLELLEARLRLASSTPPPPAPSPAPPTPVASVQPVSAPPAAAAAEPPVIRPAAPVTPTPPAAPRRIEPPAAAPAVRLPAVNWEQFMGAKLFAWLGGLALFLGVAFFVKYSFEHNLVPPEVRVAIGFLLGAGLVVGGLLLARGRFQVTAQTFVATGIVSLYAVTFACNSFYHFPAFGVGTTFLLMSLITAVAFVLAVRQGAQVVAILGMLGGFLTPVLLSTGQDNPVGLFGYLGLLDAGLLAVALHRRWHYLIPLGAAGTMLMQIRWVGSFFLPAKAPVAVTVSLGFCGLFLAGYGAGRRLGRRSHALAWTAAAMPLAAFGFVLYLLGYPAVAARPGLVFLHLFVADAALLIVAWLDEDLPRLHLGGGAAAFILLAIWTGTAMTEALLPWGLAAALIFAGLHTAFPLLLERRRPEARTGWSQVFPAFTLLLMMFPVVRFTTTPWLVWPAVLLVDLLALGLAALTASLAVIAAVLVLTLVVTGLWLFQMPAGSALELDLLVVTGGFALFFVAASLWLVRRLGDNAPGGKAGPVGRVVGDARAQLPALSSLLPFLLLVMACLRLRVPDPSAVFGLGLLLVVLLLGLARFLAVEWLPACALGGMVLLEWTWFEGHFTREAAGPVLAWTLGIHAVFAVQPFLFRRAYARLTGPWAVAALSGVPHFWIIHRLVHSAWPQFEPGIVPALFALPPLAGLAAIWQLEPADNPRRNGQLAWFGGATLFFVTLIFPVQFERQWITLGWALEGVALLWLFHRIPHRGLRGTGAVLLAIAFVRLALNPAVYEYHVREDTPLLNWYLYAYGVVLACQFAGARLYRPPEERLAGVPVPPLLDGLGIVLAFLLVNIEIADFFTRPGAPALAFVFSGNFARDMTYTIAWAVFALGLLAAGLWRQSRPARYAALGLLGVALGKLFLHDLARLEALYRIGALFAVAIIAILASVAYQRFQPGGDAANRPPP